MNVLPDNFEIDIAKMKVTRDEYNPQILFINLFYQWKESFLFLVPFVLDN